MRQLWTLCLAACVGLALIVGRSNASEGFDDIAKLAKSGVTEDVLTAFVQASPVAYELSVDEILFLNDLGVTPKTIQDILNHGKDLRAGKDPIIADPQPPANNQQFNDDAVATPVNLASFDGNNAQALPVDNANGNDPQQGYVSPLTGEVSYTPELVQEKEIVRDTVYTPTPVSACQDCTISHFYETLTPYGTWVNLDNTWCWQPSAGAADRDWQPYGNRGHWDWTDSGWCWESDYSWGWAPFHYGRWWRAPGYGWMWTPDTVWGPAWVNWRQNETHWGWAPLPPAARFETRADVGVGFHFGGRGLGLNVGLDFGLSERDYCFVPQDRFCDRNLNTFFVARERRGEIYSQTTIIQNNIIIQNNNVFVNGPSSRIVEQRIGRPLRQIRIADNDITVGVTLGRTTIYDKDAGVVRFYRPHVSAGVAIESPSEIAARQVARNAGNVRPTADARVLAASARADELRERHFATQDARRQESLTRQSEVIEEATARRSDNETRRLTTLAAKADTAEQRAAFAAKAAAERQRGEEARLQKASLEKQAAEQRKLTEQLSVEQNRVARAKASAESAKQAEAAKAELLAQRAAREKANKDSAALTEKAAADQRARNQATRLNTKSDVEARNQAAATDREARLAADRSARETTRKTQEDLAARQRAQTEADRATRVKPNMERPNVATPPNRIVNEPTPREAVRTPNAAVNTPVQPTNPAMIDRTPREAVRTPNAGINTPVQPTNPAVIDRTPREAVRTPNAAVNTPAEKAAERAADRDTNKAAREAAAEAQREKAEAARAAAATRAAANKAERQLPPAERQPINPKTGQPYDPNDPNNPRKRN